MGVIVHANDDHDANDDYLLINSSNVVVNSIVASYNFCNGVILNSYSYLVDITVSEQTGSIGWTYDPEMDTFTAPEEDFEGELEAALLDVDAAIEAAAEAYMNCTTEQQSLAVANVASELSSNTEDEIALMTAVTDYLGTLEE